MCKRRPETKMRDVDTRPAMLEPLLCTLSRELRDLYGERYRGLVLYGSYSRGEADEGSDVDLLLLLDGEVNTGAEIRRISHITAPLSLESGYVLSVIPVRVEDYHDSTDPFLANARREGIPAASET